jgi:hypothetical protein
METIQEDSNSTSSASSNQSLNADLITLEEHIEHMKTTSSFLAHRLDTIQRLLDQNTFELEKLQIKPNPSQKPNQVCKLLEALGVDQSNLVLGDFLRALNRYLIKEDLVDLNDLQIHLNPLLKAAFQKPEGLKKIPYALLLNSLPKMFI